jgi:Lipocalin-like domain
MRDSALALAVTFLLLVQPAKADDSAAKLHGVWKLVSLKIQVIGENIPPIEPLGKAPKGYIIFLPEGRMITLHTSSDRKPPTNDADSAALLRTMIAYSGKYTADAENLSRFPMSLGMRFILGTNRFATTSLMATLCSPERPSNPVASCRVNAWWERTNGCASDKSDLRGSPPQSYT